ncbi:PAS domain-containing sensor histidine kinase [Limisalsivibrio acetivorans]|uniref:PAS domain-containing sensor histidine kinase n=1 Tax=Limisalsivibrio acetivorans TaxID=1304888 RepID=UPI00138AE215|nr:PAS domain-containing sensor histidine kinase [Limisalsivibrio acetivorans]
MILAVYAYHNLQQVEDQLREDASRAFDKQAAEALRLRAELVASEVSQFLKKVEDDLETLALLEPEQSKYISFAEKHSGSIWYVKNGREFKERIPLYSETAFIKPDGEEAIRLVGSRPAPVLRNVSDPNNTTYRNEDYFNRAVELGGDVYTSRLAGLYVSREQVERGHAYRGVIRFAKAVLDGEDKIKGVAVLSVDHRHLMEFTQHITPASENYVAEPSYESGNYAFMFDDEGWIITHPKPWDIRGYDASGRLVPPYSEDTPPEYVSKGIIPYNLFHAEFIHKNYPVVADAVLDGYSGIVDVTNVGGSKKIMAYAPIKYETGVYEDSGYFGGITIGAEVRYFHQPAQMISDVIGDEVKNFFKSSFIIMLITAGIVLVAAYRISFSITNPLQRLTAGTRRMAEGDLDTFVDVQSGDEVGLLAESFNDMAKELEQRNARLHESLAELRLSREEIIVERNFKTTVFENIETGVAALSSDNRITYINAPAREYFGIGEGDCIELVSENYPELGLAVAEGLTVSASARWSRYVDFEKGGVPATYRVAFLPMKSREERIITVEDLTERVSMRRQMERMERLSSMGRLSAGLAHEIRNPLTGVSIMLDSLHDRLIKNPDDQKLIQRSLQEIERLEGLVNELLNFTTASSSEMRLNGIDCFLNDTLFFVSKQCEKSGIELYTDLPEASPKFMMDCVRLKQAFLNLFTNAMEAMPQGGRLVVKVRDNGYNLSISISDTGCGIPADRIPFIFEPFYTSKGEGTGLGLAITHNIILEHGGRIDVKSKAGEGSEFTISFPLKEGGENPPL